MSVDLSVYTGSFLRILTCHCAIANHRRVLCIPCNHCVPGNSFSDSRLELHFRYIPSCTHMSQSQLSANSCLSERTRDVAGVVPCWINEWLCLWARYWWRHRHIYILESHLLAADRNERIILDIHLLVSQGDSSAAQPAIPNF